MGTTYINSMTTSMSLVSIKPAPMVVDWPLPTLEEVTDAEN